MNKQEKDIKDPDCNCIQISSEEINSVVDEIVEKTGREKDKVIQILQEVQLGGPSGGCIPTLCHKDGVEHCSHV